MAICSLNLCKIKMSVKIVLAVTLLILVAWGQSPFSFNTRTRDYNMTVAMEGPRALQIGLNFQTRSRTLSCMKILQARDILLPYRHNEKITIIFPLLNKRRFYQVLNQGKMIKFKTGLRYPRSFMIELD